MKFEQETADLLQDIRRLLPSTASSPTALAPPPAISPYEHWIRVTAQLKQGADAGSDACRRELLRLYDKNALKISLGQWDSLDYSS
jgi:hypothetical protein